VNSQSGKGGVAYLLQEHYGLDLPRGLQIEFAQRVQAIADLEGGELVPSRLFALFRETYLEPPAEYELLGYGHEATDSGETLHARLGRPAGDVIVEGVGNGPIAALVRALDKVGVYVKVLDYHEHALSTGEDAVAAAYIEAEIDGEVVWGVALHASIVTASLRAVVAAVNRAAAARAERRAALNAFSATT
jgi:2-isopropylmalate synthase